MLQLITGIHRLRPEAFRRPGAAFVSGRGESGVLFMTCCDLGVDPMALLEGEDGPARENLHVLRKPGRVAEGGPGVDRWESDVTAALGLHEISDVVVCGHLPCAVTREILADLLAWMGDAPPATSRGLDHAEKASQIVREHYRHLTGERLAEAVAGEGVLVQLEHLTSIPAVNERLNRGRLKLHGWIFANGSLYAYDVLQEQYVLLEPAPATAR